jgi:hypothetical protein
MAWRPALHYFVNHADELDAETIADTVAFLEEVWGHRDFSMQGRTPSSMAKHIAAWRRRREPGYGSIRTWAGLGGPTWTHRDGEDTSSAEPRRWHIVEIRDADELWKEGREMRNCVATYRAACEAGRSSIWSLRREAPDGRALRCVTIEVDPRRRCIVQIRGYGNRRATATAAALLGRWASTRQLRIARGSWG